MTKRAAVRIARAVQTLTGTNPGLVWYEHAGNNQASYNIGKAEGISARTIGQIEKALHNGKRADTITWSDL